MAKKTVNLPYDLLCSIDESQAELPVNGEYENMLSAIDSAQGGTLVFENAHELYRIEKNNNYDTEQRIIRVLIDGLENVKKYPKWMLVLVGEPDGLESELAANPTPKLLPTASATSG